MQKFSSVVRDKLQARVNVAMLAVDEAWNETAELGAKVEKYNGRGMGAPMELVDMYEDALRIETLRRESLGKAISERDACLDSVIP